MKISAYIPCYNNRATIAVALASIRAQSRAVDELFVVDDGSTDGSAEVVESLGERVIRLGTNLGRGAARARAMREAQNDLVLSCDATVAIPPDFLEHALKWFEEPGTAAVFGRIAGRSTATAAERWRNRHLFKSDLQPALSKKASLITSASVLRKSSCEKCGGFNPALRHTEDADLGDRLLKAGYGVIFDPELESVARESDSLGRVLERYWRWHAGTEPVISWKAYVRQIAYSVKIMARQDLQAGDPPAALISLLSPHHQFAMTLIERRKKNGQGSPR
jgi:GT2 family glycosyltransferase